jgi:hypothetical protein
VSPIVSRVVAIGRTTKGAEKFILKSYIKG